MWAALLPLLGQLLSKKQDGQGQAPAQLGGTAANEALQEARKPQAPIQPMNFGAPPVPADQKVDPEMLSGRFMNKGTSASGY